MLPAEDLPSHVIMDASTEQWYIFPEAWLDLGDNIGVSELLCHPTPATNIYATHLYSYARKISPFGEDSY
jgi:hypothetical protein